MIRPLRRRSRERGWAAFCYEGITMSEQERLVRQQEVFDRTGLSRTSVWRLEKAGEFPKRRQIIGKTVAWVESEIVEWIQARPVVGGS